MTPRPSPIKAGTLATVLREALDTQEEATMTISPYGWEVTVTQSHNNVQQHATERLTDAPVSDTVRSEILFVRLANMLDHELLRTFGHVSSDRQWECVPLLSTTRTTIPRKGNR